MRLILILLCAVLLPACGVAEKRVNRADIETPLMNAEYQTISLHKLRSGHDVIKAHINGIEGAFIVDTGAGYTVLSSEATETFGLSQEILRSETSAGAGGRTSLTVHAVDEVLVDGIPTPLETVYVTDLSNVMSALSQLYGAPLSGIVGQDVLTSLGAILDVRTDTLFLHTDPDAACLNLDRGCSEAIVKTLSAQGFHSVALEILTTGHIAFEAELNGEVGTFLVDSGARESFLNLDDIDRFRAGRDSKLTQGRQISGAGGSAQSFRLPVISFSLQGVPIQARTIGVVDLSAVADEIAARGGGDIDGVIGQDVLQDHQAVIDLNGPTLYILER